MPPPQKFTPDRQGRAATRLFVDRIGPRRLFTEALEALSGESQSFLVFYGMGGQGKSALRDECTRIVVAERRPGRDIRCGVIDLRHRKQRIPCYASLWARNALVERGVRTPAFDLAFGVYWMAAFAEQPMPKTPHSSVWRDGAGADVAGEAGETAVKEVLKLIADGVLEGIPFVGSAMRKLSGWTMSKVTEKVLRRTNATLKRAWPDGGPPEQLYQQEEMLPWILAQDLAAWIEAHPDDRLVLLVDEYESAFPEGLSGERRLTNPFDATMRELAAQIKGILWVFFSRERLPWPEIDPDWTGYLHGCQHPLGGLEMADAEAFLDGVPVPEMDLRQAMLMEARDEDGVTCYPLLLDLQVSHYWDLKQSGRIPVEADFTVTDNRFQARSLAILTRFLRDYSPALKATLTRLAVARRFDRATFEHIVRHFMTGFPLDHWSSLSSLSFVDPSDDDFVLQSRIREMLAGLLDENDRRATHAALFAHFDQRAACDQLKDAGLDKLEALTEAFHHKRARDGGNAVEWVLDCNAYDPDAQSRLSPFIDAGLLRAAGSLIDLVSAAAETTFQAGLALQLGGLALFGDGHLDEAERLERLALESFVEALPAGHPDIATSLNNLAEILRAKGELDAAEQLQREALQLRRTALPDGHPDIATSLNNLAGTLGAKGELDAAQQLQREALQLLRDALPAGHPDIAGSLNNLAEILRAKGELDAAEQLQREALQLRRAALPAGHPDIAASLNNLAETLRAKGELDAAQQLHREALQLRRAALPAGHPDIAGSLINLAETLRAKGELDAAEQLQREVLQLRRTALPDGHPDIATSLNNLAGTLGAKGELDAAQQLHRKVLQLRRTALPAGHPDIAGSLNNLAETLRAKGELDAAEQLHREALQLLRDALPTGHPSIAVSVNNLLGTLVQQAWTAASQGRFVQAKRLRREADVIRSQSASRRSGLPSDNP